MSVRRQGGDRGGDAWPRALLRHLFVLRRGLTAAPGPGRSLRPGRAILRDAEGLNMDKYATLFSFAAALVVAALTALVGDPKFAVPAGIVGFIVARAGFWMASSPVFTIPELRQKI